MQKINFKELEDKTIGELKDFLENRRELEFIKEHVKNSPYKLVLRDMKGGNEDDRIRNDKTN